MEFVFLASHQHFIYESQAAVSQHERGKARDLCNQSKIHFNQKFTTLLNVLQLYFTSWALAKQQSPLCSTWMKIFFPE